jgi:hypothetical protein
VAGELRWAWGVLGAEAGGRVGEAGLRGRAGLDGGELRWARGGGGGRRAAPRSGGDGDGASVVERMGR